MSANSKDPAIRSFEENNTPSPNSPLLCSINLPKETDPKIIKAKDSQKELVEIEPGRCKPWSHHNRDVAWLTTERCKDLIHSIQKNGQIEPVLVRKIQNDLNYDWELIFGVRRWYACSQIPHQKLLAYTTDFDDKNCTILMHAENACSKDISEFERAFSFAAHLKSGVFKNQMELADAMGVSQSTISKMVNAARIFEVDWISQLFPSKLDISVKQAYHLSTLLSDPKFTNIIKEEASLINQTIENGYLKPSIIIQRLINKTKPKSFISNEIIHLTSNNMPVITSSLNKLGKFIISIDPTIKQFSIFEIENVFMQILDNYILKQSIPGK